MTKKSSPDWFARGVAGLGIILSGIGLYFTYTSNNWQKATYAESQEDRVSARLSIKEAVDYRGKNKLVPKPDGTVTVEVVNLGIRTLYVKKVAIQPQGELYYLSITQQDKPPERVEPGEAHYFRSSWDFSKHTLKNFPSGPDEKNEKVAVMVETTRKTISLPVTPRFDSIEISGDIP